MRRTVFFGLRRTPAALVLAAWIAPAISGCGGSDALKKQVEGFETQLTSMRADQDRLEERLAAVELAEAGPTRPTKTSQTQVEHPRLKVIHLSPDQAGPAAEPGDAPSDGADSNAHRPAIRGTGDKLIKTGDADDASIQTSPHTPPHSGVTKQPPVAQLGDPHGN